jgi:hypothetical protein
MRKKMATVVLVAMMTNISAPAQAAFCFEPKAPSILFLRKPTKPYCASTQSCEEWEVESYKSDVRRYYRSLEDYASSVDRFYKQAAEYVGCMSKLD